uniref:Uncharacterized protein n=1 Tax=Eptatretus burgeri TaxID=7764 RepID=A0A8C4Q129_EPTBU
MLIFKKEHIWIHFKILINKIDVVDDLSAVYPSTECCGMCFIQWLRMVHFCANHAFIFTSFDLSSQSGKLSRSGRSPLSRSLGTSRKKLQEQLMALKVAEGSPSNTHVFPPLVGCKAPVEDVLPQLASPAGLRGLGKLLHAKNVLTVGDLSLLGVRELQALPIRAPKLHTLCGVLTSFQQQRKGGDAMEFYPQNGPHEDQAGNLEATPGYGREERTADAETVPRNAFRELRAKLESLENDTEVGSILHELLEEEELRNGRSLPRELLHNVQQDLACLAQTLINGLQKVNQAQSLLFSTLYLQEQKDIAPE